MSDLGSTYNSQGRYDDARSLYEEALAGLKEQQGERDRDVLAIVASLGNCYNHLGLLDQAENLCGRALAFWGQDFGNEHPVTLDLCMRLGEMYHSQGRLYEAADLFIRVSDARAEVLWMDHTKYLETYELLGIVYGGHAELEGNFESADKCYKRVLDSRETRLDRNIPRLVEILLILKRLDIK